MASRSSSLTGPVSISCASSAALFCRSACAKSCCVSSNRTLRSGGGLGRAAFQVLGRKRGLLEQHGQGRNIRVPFDQRRYRAKARAGGVIQLPYGIADRRAVIVDQNAAAAAQFPGAVAGQMDFTDPLWRERCQIFKRIPAVIAAADIN